MVVNPSANEIEVRLPQPENDMNPILRMVLGRETDVMPLQPQNV